MEKEDIQLEIEKWERVIRGAVVREETVEEWLARADEAKEPAEFFENIYGRVFRHLLQECYVLSYKTDEKRARALGLDEEEELLVPKRLAQIFFGREDVLARIRSCIAAGVIGKVEQRKIPHLVGEPAGGKTDLIKVLADFISTGEQTIFIIKDCPVFDHPRRLIPRRLRPEYRRYRVHLDPREDIDRKCRMELYHLMSQEEDPETKRDAWKKMLVQEIKVSPRREIGYVFIPPVETLTTDVSDLIGVLNIPALMAGLPEGHPGTLLPVGKLSHQQVVVHFDEILRNSPHRLKILLNMAEDRIIPGPANYGIVHTDILPIGTSNVEIYEEFSSDPANRPFVDRMDTILFRNNLSVSEEVKIYLKLFGDSALELYGFHEAPHALSLAAFLAVASRLPEPSEISYKGKKDQFALEQLIRILDGDDTSDLPPARAIYDDNPNLGLQPGLTVRFVQGAMEKSVGERLGTEKPLCLLPQKVLAALKAEARETFFTEPDLKRRKRYLELIPETERQWQKLLRTEAFAILRAVFFEEGEEVFRKFILAGRLLQLEEQRITSGQIFKDTAEVKKARELSGRVKSHIRHWNKKLEEGILSREELNPEDFEDLFFACLMVAAKEEDVLKRLHKEFDNPEFSDYKARSVEALVRLGYRECCVQSVIPYILSHIDNIAKAA